MIMQPVTAYGSGVGQILSTYWTGNQPLLYTEEKGNRVCDGWIVTRAIY